MRLLGDALGAVIKRSAGDDVFQNIERIRQASKDAKDAELTEALFEQMRDLTQNNCISLHVVLPNS